jgi:hypothetical protein
MDHPAGIPDTPRARRRVALPLDDRIRAKKLK